MTPAFATTIALSTTAPSKSGPASLPTTTTRTTRRRRTTQPVRLRRIPTVPSTNTPSTTTSSKSSSSIPSSSPQTSTAPSSSSTTPTQTAPSSSPSTRRSARAYRCSRCGEVGHNVRACPGLASSTWFRQRCGRCGRGGHNIRNCTYPEGLVKEDGAVTHAPCRVCSGARRLPCAQCEPKSRSTSLVSAARARGRLVAANATALAATNLPRARARIGAALSREQRAMAERARRRVREVLDVVDDAELVGFPGNDVEAVGDMVGDEGVSAREETPFCSRCLGTGYLSCMACSEE